MTNETKEVSLFNDTESMHRFFTRIADRRGLSGNDRSEYILDRTIARIRQNYSPITQGQETPDSARSQQPTEREGIESPLRTRFLEDALDYAKSRGTPIPTHRPRAISPEEVRKSLISAFSAVAGK